MRGAKGKILGTMSPHFSAWRWFMKLMLRGSLAAVLCSFVFSFAYAQSQTGDSKPLLPSTSADTSAAAQTAAPKAKAKDPHIQPGTDYPHEELALLYSYVNFVPGNNNPNADYNGASGSFAYNFNRYAGLVGDLGLYHAGDYGGANISSKVASYMFGPRVSFRGDSRVTPYLQVLLGGVHTGTFLGTPPSHNGFAIAGGGGLDWTLSRRVALRLPQLEYLFTTVNTHQATFEAHQRDLRASAGLVFRFGYHPVAINATPTAACSVNPTAVTIGSDTSAALNVNAADADNDALTYSYSATGGNISGTGGTARWDLAGANPGSYNATANVNDGHGGMVSCSAAVTVNPRPIPPNRPPTVTLSSDRDNVLVGECVRFTANGADPDGDPLRYSWSSNGGQLTPTNNTAQWCANGLNPGNYTTTVRVDDGKGGAADAAKSIGVTAPPPPPQATKLSECAFKPAASARVDNVCKRILDDVATRLQNDAGARVVLVGYADPRQRQATQIATNRGKNAQTYLGTKGIDANRVETRTGAGQAGAGVANQRIEIIYVPQGASY
jgi:outer membrane protein OmpA-like peptidoglycan-associated protein